MNNGMTVKKLEILRHKLNLVICERNAGHISSAMALTSTMILLRDILIYEGLEKAYLQG